MENTDYERLEKVVKYLNLSFNALSRELGLKSPQVFYDIRAGKHGVSKELANKINGKYLINNSWLLTGEGDMLKQETTSFVNYNKGVPYYDVDFLGGFDLLLNDQTTNPEYLIDFGLYNRADCFYFYYLLRR